jgi:hypothetical protein
MLLRPSAPAEYHWLAGAFPTGSSRPGYRCIRTTVYDNRRALGEACIEGPEAADLAGTVLRGQIVDGLRGRDPVYGGIFQRTLRVDSQVAHDPETSLLEGRDFGHGHPGVV